MAHRQIPLRQVLFRAFIVLGIAFSESHAFSLPKDAGKHESSQLSFFQKELLTKIKRKMSAHGVDVLCTSPDGAEVSLKLEILKKDLSKISVESSNEYYFLKQEGTRYKCQKSAF